MRRNLGTGLVLGIALFMLLPVYASAQMSLNNLSGASAGTSIGSIMAIQGDTNPISFTVTSPLPNISMITPPEQNASFPSTTTGTGTFTWNTSGFPAGSYVAVFESTDGGTSPQVQYLVAMIRINPSTGSNPTETITVSFASPPTSGTAGTPVTFTANAATSSLGTDTFQYNFMWGDGTSTGFGTSLSANHTYNTTTTQSFLVTVQAKCSHGVIGQASTNISITGSGGGGGSYSQLVASAVSLDFSANYGGAFGYVLAGGQQYTIQAKSTTYFVANPPLGKTIRVRAIDYDQSSGHGFLAKAYILDVNNNLIHGPLAFAMALANQGVINLSGGTRYLIEIDEDSDMSYPMSIFYTIQN